MDINVRIQVNKYKDKFKGDLMKYINDVEYMTEMVGEFNKGHLKEVIKLNIPDNMIIDTLKGLILFEGKNPNVSKEILDVLLYISNENYDGRDDKSVYAVDCITSRLKSKNKNKEALYKFLESAHVSGIIHRIGYCLFGDGFHAPPFAIAYMINPSKVEKILSKPKPIHLFEEMVDSNFYDIIEHENEGKKIYDKLSLLIEQFNIERYSMTA